MAFTKWKTFKKIDAHIHILPDAVHEANPNSKDAWLCTDLHQYHNDGKTVCFLNTNPWQSAMYF